MIYLMHPFAVGGSVQESLGFSLFELIFGHSVRGPLKLLKEQWLTVEQQSNLLTYVCRFREMLTHACEIAMSNLKQTQGQMKARYDRNTELIRKLNLKYCCFYEYGWWTIFSHE